MANPIGDFVQVSNSTMPKRFFGFFEPVTEAQMTARGHGGISALTETEITVDYSVPYRRGEDYAYTPFVVEVFLSDLQNSSLLKNSYAAKNPHLPPEPRKFSCVLEDILYAEQYHRGEATNRGQPKYTQSQIDWLLAHEIGHYRIARLIALDLYRTLEERAARSRSNDPRAMEAAWRKCIRDFCIIKDMIQTVYDIATVAGSDRAGQSRWLEDVLNRAERSAGAAENTSIFKINASFWPGLEFSLVTPPSGAPAREKQLAREILGLYGGGSEINTVALEQLNANLKAEWNRKKAEVLAARAAAARAAAAGRP
jgi:hypothetical protein